MRSVNRIVSVGCRLLLAGVSLWGCTHAPHGIDHQGTVPQTVGTEIPGLPPIDPDVQYNHVFVHRTPQEFLTWEKNGIAAKPAGANVRLELEPQKSGALRCESEDIDGGIAQFDKTSGLCLGQDPAPTGLPSGVTYYNGGSFYFGTMLSPELTPKVPIDHVIASWNAVTPPGTWLELHLRVKTGDGWSRFYKLPIWASDANTLKRHSVKEPADQTGYVDTDTFELRNQKTASSYQLSVTLFSADPTKSPSLSLVAAVASRDKKEYPVLGIDPSSFDVSLPIPHHSQELAEYKKPEYKEYGGGGPVWCSPTSTTMVMEYYSRLLGDSSLQKTVPQVAIGCYDWVYKGTGNWPFNTAYAAEAGLASYITRFYSFAHAAPWLRAGIPLVISIAFKAGELPGAPISKTNGHLIVVRGFDKNGDVLVNDPAAPEDASVPRTYPRAALEAAWSHSHRTAYVMFPKAEVSVPADPTAM
ncbi:MAG TPA: C39 family peptidase [Pseudomonadota bacterium]|nr:C39 family peptidase [Pseudomonadota bacterium]